MTEMDGVIREHEAILTPIAFQTEEITGNLCTVRYSILMHLPMSQVYFATLAEQAERYDEMAEHMKSAEASVIWNRKTWKWKKLQNGRLLDF